MVAYLTGIIWWIFVEIEIANDFYNGDENFKAKYTPTKFFPLDAEGGA